jgi:hypothetical protein
MGGQVCVCVCVCEREREREPQIVVVQMDGVCATQLSGGTKTEVVEVVDICSLKNRTFANMLV